jgi:hypothetical protein
MSTEAAPEVTLPPALEALVSAYMNAVAPQPVADPTQPTPHEAARAVLRLAGALPYSFPTGGAKPLGESPEGRALLALSPVDKTQVAVAAYARWSHASAWTSPWERVISDLFRSKLELNVAQALDVLASSKRLVPNFRYERISSVTGALKRCVERHGLTPELKASIADLRQTMTASHTDSHLDGRKIIKSLDEMLDFAAAEQQAESVFNPRPDAWGRAVVAHLAGLPAASRADITRLLLLASEGGEQAKPSKTWLKQAKSLLASVDGETLGPQLLDIIALYDCDRAHVRPRIEREISLENQATLRGLLWLAAMAAPRAATPRLEALARTYLTWTALDYNSLVLGNAAIHAFSLMPGYEGVGGLSRLRRHLKRPGEVKTIDKALAALADVSGITADELEEIGVPIPGDETSAAEVEETIKAQRLRLERIYLADRVWPFEVWRERYLEHPLVAPLARLLIWSFEREGSRTSGLPVGDGFIDANGNELVPDAGVHVKLWHPMRSDTAEVLAWRGRIRELGVTQPFKQAHREIYVLTDAERETRTYSNRFAGHILAQKVFRALTMARGWKAPLQGKWDGGGSPLKELPAHDLRFTFALKPVETSANERWEFEHLSSTAVGFSRFLGQRIPQTIPLRNGANFAFVGPALEPVPLEDVDPVLFSEMMRDVDLFVGVAGIGNDPTWADRCEHDFIGYWRQSASGTLTETGKTRRAVLADLLPSLSIASRARLDERHLVIEGKLRTYRIHLGSANVQMEPDDQYLCIVPAKTPTRGPVYLPFEGDATLAIILSKAFMLADDDAITDRSIRAQINARRV